MDAEFMDEYAREIERLDGPLCLRILSRIETPAQTPRPDGCRKLRGSTDLWRIRIGDYRVLYAVDDARKLVDVIAIRHRSGAYR
jgi:mRNA interferase RelE/StbE